MRVSIKDKVVVITGAGGGIGKVIAQALAEEGAAIALCGGNNLERLAETERLVREKGAKVFTLPGDLTDESFIDTCLDKIAEHFGKIDILINNAGVAMHMPYEQVSYELFDKIMEINVRVPFFLCQKALPHLRKSDHATIINMASVVGHKGYVNQSVYVASKHALIGASKTLANEVYKENIRVHTVCPGGVFTDMIKLSRPDLTGEDMIMPEDIAEIVLFLLQSRTNAVIDEICVHRSGKQPYEV